MVLNHLVLCMDGKIGERAMFRQHFFMRLPISCIKERTVSIVLYRGY